MKKSYYCEKLEKTLHFLPEEIKFCCSCAEGLGIKIKDFSKVDKKEIIKVRNKYIKQLKNGVIPSQCFGCLELKEQKIQKESLFQKILKKKENKVVSHVIVDHYKQCDCSCIYCSQKILHPDVIQKYELLPIIEQLYDQKLLSKQDLVVEFQGGNISMLSEFDNLIKTFNSNECHEFRLLMNGIKYLPVLETISFNNSSFVSISLDSGTRETFCKIKNVDAFEQTIENIKKLEKRTDLRFSFKYILIKDVNDNKEEIEKFINVVKSFERLNNVIFDIDYRDTFMIPESTKKVPSYYKELFDYAEKLCNDNKIVFTISEYTKKILSDL